jgi:hypothetical protein
MFGPPLFKNVNDCLLRIITFIDCARDIGAPIYWRRGASVRQYIGAPMSPAQNKIFSCSVRHSYWRRVHRCANSIGGI